MRTAVSPTMTDFIYLDICAFAVLFLSTASSNAYRSVESSRMPRLNIPRFRCLCFWGADRVLPKKHRQDSRLAGRDLGVLDRPRGEQHQLRQQYHDQTTALFRYHQAQQPRLIFPLCAGPILAPTWWRCAQHFESAPAEMEPDSIQGRVDHKPQTLDCQLANPDPFQEPVAGIETATMSTLPDQTVRQNLIPHVQQTTDLTAP